MEKIMTNFVKAGEFMTSFEQEVKTEPSFPDEKTVRLRIKLIDEEFLEFIDACHNKDLVGVADALTDLLYVIYGAGHSFGVDLDKCYEEVHSSNMSKLGPDGKPLKRPDGKVMKSANYRPPNLEQILFCDKIKASV